MGSTGNHRHLLHFVHSSLSGTTQIGPLTGHPPNSNFFLRVSPPPTTHLAPQPGLLAQIQLGAELGRGEELCFCWTFLRHAWREKNDSSSELSHDTAASRTRGIPTTSLLRVHTLMTLCVLCVPSQKMGRYTWVQAFCGSCGIPLLGIHEDNILPILRESLCFDNLDSPKHGGAVERLICGKFAKFRK